MILAFVHLGTAIPRYLKENILRSLRLFPEVNVSLVCDYDLDVKDWDLPRGSKFRIYKWSRALLTLREIEILEKLENDSSFRSGYWSLTIERLFALTSIFAETDQPLLHIESDVLLFPNFPMSRFDHKISPLIWGAARDGEDIAAIFFVRSNRDMCSFRKIAFDLLETNPRHTDMSLLYEIRNRGLISVGVLPFITDHKQNTPDLRTKNINTVHLFDSFKGNFDVAPLGMWLTGIDPRNTYGFLVLRDDKQLNRIGYYSNVPQNAKFNLDESGCLWNDDVPVYSLHIHSKQVSLFSPEWVPKLRELVLRSQKLGTKIEGFNLRLFFSLLIENFRHNSFLNYIYSFFKWSFHRMSSKFHD